MDNLEASEKGPAGKKYHQSGTYNLIFNIFFKNLTKEPRELLDFFGPEIITNRLAMSKNGRMQSFSG
jgi:hypothetical protein